MGRRMRMLAVVTAVATMLVAGAGRPAGAEESFAADFGVGVGAVATNLLYVPAKIVYATLGGITGGFAYLLTGGNLGVGRAIWVPSMGGTYVITPAMLRGRERVYFTGTTEPERAPGRRGGPPPRRADERPGARYDSY
jgi:hypothetical protein